MRSGSVVGYVRVSTAEQRDTGLGLEAQRTAITAEAARRGWEILEIVEDAGYSAKDLARPGMGRVLELLRTGAAGALVVAKLDRATRSTMDAASLLLRAKSEGWTFVALDLGVDTGTPTGELVASVMAAVSQWERRAIGQRTKEALEAKRDQGVALGRPAVLDEAVVRRILLARSREKGWTAIASELNDEGVPTAHGGRKWYPSTVRAVVIRHG